jgi:hypothetical protein
MPWTPRRNYRVHLLFSNYSIGQSASSGPKPDLRPSISGVNQPAAQQPPQTPFVRAHHCVGDDAALWTSWKGCRGRSFANHPCRLSAGRSVALFLPPTSPTKGYNAREYTFVPAALGASFPLFGQLWMTDGPRAINRVEFDVFARCVTFKEMNK